MQSFFRKIFILIWKDFLIDLRRKENIPSMFLFLAINFLIFIFSFGDETKILLIALPGIIWVIFLFSGVLGLEKSYSQESDSGCMGGLLTAPIDRGVLFIGKMLANTLFLFITQLFFLPLVVAIFNIELKSWSGLLYLLILGTVGFSSLGTLLTALTASVKGKEMLLPVLIFPLMVPGLLCVVNLTDFLFFGTNPDDVWSWWKFLLAFDVILFTVSFLGFEFVIEE